MTACVDLWHWHLVEADHAVLSPDELERENRFVFSQDRSKYIAGRGKLRTILARYFGQTAEDIVFRYGEFGRPEVAGLQFNLSHTDDTAVLAVSPDLPLGVDIEAVRPIDLDVARLHFAPAEMAALLDLLELARIAAFYRCWTRKEAYLKARGAGLMTDLNSFCVTLGPDVPARLLHCDSREVAAWSLFDIATEDGVAGAPAVLTNGAPFKIFTN